jgi:8-oxo-dGTP pyrophosphatase MutT (NUDIX family)
MDGPVAMTQRSDNFSMSAIEQALRSRPGASARPARPAARTAAVYVLFSTQDEGPVMTLIRRSESVGQHRGEYAFPGGGVEPHDHTLHDTALREAQEELGVAASDIEPWGGLDAESTVTSGYLVVPFTGRLGSGARLSPAPAEVSEVVRVPVSCLADPASERVISRLTASQGQARELQLSNYPAYAFDGRVIWGATARIIAQVVTILRAA